MLPKSEPLRASEQAPESLRRMFVPIVRHYTYDPCEVEDFLQEAVIHATAVLAREPHAPRARIIKAGRNRILDQVRAAARRRSVLPSTDIETALPENGGGIREAEDRTFIAQVFKRLRPEDVEALLLSSEASAPEAAERMGVTVASFKARLYRARSRAHEVAGLGGAVDGKD